MRLYAEFDSVVAAERADEWADDDHLREVAEYVEEQIVSEGRLDPEVVSDHFDLEDDPDQRRYAYLRGIDSAMRFVHPFFDEPDRGGMIRLAIRFRRENRFNTDARAGALLPRFAFPERFRAMGDDMAIESKADLFEYVTVADAAQWEKVASVRLARHHCPPPTVRLDGLVAGCAPVCEGDDVRISLLPSPPRRRYEIFPTGPGPANRIQGIVEQLDAAGAHIGVMPELTLDAELLGVWQECLARVRPPLGSQLRLIMVGTGSLEPSDNGELVNRGVLLHRSGRRLLEQDKRHPFTLDAAMVEQWGLAGELGRGAASEPIRPGHRLCVAEGPFGRLVILVCEDLGRTIEDGALLLAVGPSLCLAPVLSKPTLAHFWEHSSAKKISAEIGSNTVVANSLIIEARQLAAGITPDGRGTALAHTPSGFKPGYAHDAGTVVVLRLHPDGAFVLS